MGADTRFLLLQRRVVEHHRHGEGQHKQDLNRQQAHHQQNQQHRGKDQVGPEHFRAAVGGALVGIPQPQLDVIQMMIADFHYPEAFTLLQAKQHRHADQRHAGDKHRGQHRDEDVQRINAQRRRGTGCRATPRGEVHNTAGEVDQAGHRQHVHPEFAVQR